MFKSPGVSTSESIIVNEKSSREKVRFTLKWTIDNVEALQLRKGWLLGNRGITMAELGVENEFQGRWQIVINPGYTAIENGVQISYLSILLRLTDAVNSNEYHGRKETDVDFKSHLLTGKLMEKTIRLSPEEKRCTFSSRQYMDGWEKFIANNKLFGCYKEGSMLSCFSGAAVKVLMDDCITVITECVMYMPLVTTRVTETAPCSSAQRYRDFVAHQYKWFNSADFRDSANFVLQSSDGKEFPLHRFLLMAHSAVFAAMLTHDTQEKEKSRCELKDLDGECISILLDYLYGCDVGKITASNAEKALIMADKYDITGLRAVCEEMLANNVCATKAVHYLVLASERELNVLKRAALAVIPKHMGSVMQNGALEEAIQSDPALIQTIMEHCSGSVRAIPSNLEYYTNVTEDSIKNSGFK